MTDYTDYCETAMRMLPGTFHYSLESYTNC